MKSVASLSAVAVVTALTAISGAASASRGSASLAAAPARAPVAAHVPARKVHGATAKKVPLTIKAGKAVPKAVPKPPCMRNAVVVTHNTEEDTFPLTRCDGSPAPLAVEHLSVMARPGSAPKPTTTFADLAKAKGPSVSPGIRRVDPVLVERLQALVDHFTKGKPAHIQVISGFRPSSVGSYHASGRALDFRMDGVTNEDLVAYCKSLPDTGCGYYPNSSFIHIDVRDRGTGHVSWIDASGPGETPRYLSSWPPSPAPNDDTSAKNAKDPLAKLDKGLPPLPIDEHPATPPGEAATPIHANVSAPEASAKADSDSTPRTMSDE